MENKTSDVQPTCQGPLQLLSPPFSNDQHHKTDAAKRVHVFFWRRKLLLADNDNVAPEINMLFSSFRVSSCR